METFWYWLTQDGWVGVGKGIRRKISAADCSTGNLLAIQMNLENWLLKWWFEYICG